MTQTGPVISVIIPVYNVEKYLSQCIESVIHQTYDNLEIILIDDGSQDQGGKICDLYEEKDKRVRVLHKINGGLSDARNCGLKLVTGQYVMFLDSDDWIDNETIGRLYELILEYDADISACSYKCVVDCVTVQDEGELDNVYFFRKQDGLDVFVRGSAKGMSGAVWGKLIRYDLLDGLEFPYGKTYEDMVYNTVLFSRSEKTVYCNRKYYMYRIEREGSITSTPWTIKKIEDYYILLNEKLEFLQSIGKAILVEHVVYDAYTMFLNIFLKSKSKDISEFLKKVLIEYRYYMIHNQERKNARFLERFFVALSIFSSDVCKVIYISMKTCGILKCAGY